MEKCLGQLCLGFILTAKTPSLNEPCPRSYFTLAFKIKNITSHYVGSCLHSWTLEPRLDCDLEEDDILQRPKYPLIYGNELNE